MSDTQLLARIVTDPKVLAGKPVIRGTRLSVEYILNLAAHGVAPAETLGEYPDLTLDDIHACYLFAARSLSAAAFLPLPAVSA